jgi:hypothetical protein
VKCIAKLGVCAIILVLAGAQPLACMLPGGATTEEESACCREMGPDCNSDDMPSSHSCCQRVSAPDRAALAKASFKLAKLAKLSVNLHYFYSGPPQAALSQGLQQTAGTAITLGHSPPGAPLLSSEILRI